MIDYTPPPCLCFAYPFPHRYGCKGCYGPELQAEIHADSFPTDETLDDPRRGQAKGLNRNG